MIATHILLCFMRAVIKPHDPRCACQECCRAQKENSLKHSKARLNTFKVSQNLSECVSVLTCVCISISLHAMNEGLVESKSHMSL